MTPYPFISELRIFSFGFAPSGWISCNGQSLPIDQNQPLFTLLGTTYGGDGIHNFRVPNLNGRVPMHRGSNFDKGSTGGEVTHTLTLAEIPNHTHQAVASPFVPDRSTPENNFWTVNTGFKPYGSQSNNPPMSPTALQSVGANLPHNNMAPFLVFNICMAVTGIFPSSLDPDSISDPWLSEIRIFAGGVIPYYWLPCDGQDISVSSNTGLFSLLGLNYGGNGTTNFGLPNLQVKAPLMAGQGNGLSNYELGEEGGVVAVTLNADEVPLHTHAAMAKESGDEGEPENRIWANPGAQPPLPNFYSSTIGSDPLKMNTGAVGSTGGGGPHNNMMPFNVLAFCITTYGDTPPR